MTEKSQNVKKHVIDERLKGLIKNYKLRTDATSKIDDKGNLIQRKHYGVSAFDVEGGIPDAVKLAKEEDMRNRTLISGKRIYELQSLADSIPDEHATSTEYRKKKYKKMVKRKTKKCRCK